jgi:gluconate 2-dehydrogenase gamma chain
MSDDSGGPGGLSRRALIGRVGAAGAFVALTDVLPPAASTAEAQPRRAPVREPLETLTPAEFETLEAVTARLIPTDATGPGAVEAGAARYIDRALGGALAGFRDAYRAGLASVDAAARGAKSASFAQLAAADQDALLTEMERNAATGFAGGSAAFFALVRSHTMQGTFGDPFYGGNRNFAGWDLIGYPGVRLAVTAAEQNLDAKVAPTHMSAYDYSMFSARKPARADLGTAHDPHGD